MISVVYILVAIIIWMAYTMYKSYVGMEKELREIRLKCMGKSGSKYNKDPAERMRSNMVSALSALANMSRT
jgi:hypothetical protein